MIGHSTLASITANGHKSMPIYCFQQPAAPPPQQLFVFGSKFANHQPHPSSSTSRNAPSTVPSPSAATTDQQAPVQQRHHRHHRLFPRTAGPKQSHEALLRAPSLTVAATGHRS